MNLKLISSNRSEFTFWILKKTQKTVPAKILFNGIKWLELYHAAFSK